MHLVGGEPTLWAFSDKVGNHLHKIKSRPSTPGDKGGITSIDEPKAPGTRMATEQEIYEHGCWWGGKSSLALSTCLNATTNGTCQNVSCWRSIALSGLRGKMRIYGYWPFLNHLLLSQRSKSNKRGMGEYGDLNQIGPPLKRDVPWNTAGHIPAFLWVARRRA
jgi:hypothetical protein